MITKNLPRHKLTTRIRQLENCLAEVRSGLLLEIRECGAMGYNDMTLVKMRKRIDRTLKPNQ